jgi:hypothetical protein
MAPVSGLGAELMILYNYGMHCRYIKCRRVVSSARIKAINVVENLRYLIQKNIEKTFSIRKGAGILYKSTKYVISHFVKGFLAMLPVHFPEYV